MDNKPKDIVRIPSDLLPKDISYDYSSFDRTGSNELYKLLILAHFKETGLINWADENLTNEIDLIVNLDTNRNEFIPYIKFTSIDDAILFKMTWC